MICLVTDRRRLSNDSDAIERLIELIGTAARAGVDLIHVRERDLDTRALSNLVGRCLTATAGTPARVLVNDRADVAVATGAHGVHLRGDSFTATAVRTLVGANALVGRSVHSEEDAVAAARGGDVDYLLFGTLFPTSSKGMGHPVATLAGLSAACRVPVPVLAIGGMTVDRAATVARAGAAGVAGIGLFVPPAGVSPDCHLRSIVAGIRSAFDTSEAVS